MDRRADQVGMLTLHELSNECRVHFNFGTRSRHEPDSRSARRWIACGSTSCEPRSSRDSHRSPVDVGPTKVHHRDLSAAARNFTQVQRGRHDLRLVGR